MTEKISETLKGARIELRRLVLDEKTTLDLKNLAQSNQDHFLPFDESLAKFISFEERTKFLVWVTRSWVQDTQWAFGIYLLDTL